jgi:hypothetical protein
LGRQQSAAAASPRQPRGRPCTTRQAPGAVSGHVGCCEQGRFGHGPRIHFGPAGALHEGLDSLVRPRHHPPRRGAHPALDESSEQRHLGGASAAAQDVPCATAPQGDLVEIWWRSGGDLVEIWWRSGGDLVEIWWRSGGLGRSSRVRGATQRSVAPPERAGLWRRGAAKRQLGNFHRAAAPPSARARSAQSSHRGRRSCRA